jgi:hypothetical protein
MLRIPFVPTAYPDEMLASLLTRLMLHNGSGLWRRLLEESGFGRRTISPFFTPPVQEAKLERLLAALGYTYPRMLRELTVLPFWLSFNRASSVRFQVNVDAVSGRATNLTRLGHKQFLPGAQYCPACLRDDIEVHGEPYLHRQHQLPVARVCTIHGVALRFACPACQTTVMPFNRALLRPPLLRCDCGEDLSRIAGPPPANLQALMRLSRFATGTLSCIEDPWTLSQVLAVLNERLGINRANFRRVAMQLLQDTYGPPDQSRYKAATLLTWEKAGSSLRLKVGGGPDLLRAPEFCALLAATKLSFDEFRQAVSQVEGDNAPVKTMPRPLTIKFARQEFQRLKAESPGHSVRRLQNSSPRHFWLLRLRDSAYMQAYGYCNYKPTPTVEADREEIEEQLQKRSGRISRNNGAQIRASIRDQAWLQSRIQAHTKIQSNRQAVAHHIQQERAVALSRAIFSLLRTQARPARIHAGLLAKFVQISMHQAQHTIAQTPALQALIAAVNAGKDRRLAFWAARSLIEEGHYPRSADVLVRAGLPAKRVNRQWCIQGIGNFTVGCTNVRSEREISASECC